MKYTATRAYRTVLSGDHAAGEGLAELQRRPDEGRPQHHHRHHLGRRRRGALVIAGTIAAVIAKLQRKPERHLMLDHARLKAWWRGRRWADDRGDASIQMAIVYPFVLLATIAVIQASMWYYARQIALTAAREGVTAARAYQAGPADGTARAQAGSWAERLGTACARPA